MAPQGQLSEHCLIKTSMNLTGMDGQKDRQIGGQYHILSGANALTKNQFSIKRNSATFHTTNINNLSQSTHYNLT